MSLSRQLANKLLIRFTTSSGGAVVTTTLSLLPQQQRQSAASSSAVRCCCWWRRQPTTPTTSRRHQSATAIHSAASRRHSLPAASSPLRISLLLQKQATDLRYATMTTATKSEALMASSKGVGTGDANVAATAAAGGGGENLFDRSVFDKTLAVPALRVPAQATAAMLRILRGHTIDLPRMPAVVSDPRDPKARLVLLSPSEFEGAAAKARAEAGGGKGDDDDDGAAASTTAAFLESLPEPARELALSSAASLTSYEIKLTYAHVSVEEALRKLLPADLKELPSAFETVGHIAHLNLREELVPFSKIIGKVLLDKNPRLRVVVNKLSSIQNEFRVFQMEVIAGRENDTVAEVSQGGCRFGLDYAKVYWNSRLEAEHARLVEAEFKPGQVVVDAMAGVGPFAIPAAKFVEGCTVYANDLNPESFRWLAENARRNKVADRVRASCCDARAFIRAFGGVDSGAWESVFGQGGSGGGERRSRCCRRCCAPLPPPSLAASLFFFFTFLASPFVDHPFLGVDPRALCVEQRERRLSPQGQQGRFPGAEGPAAPAGPGLERRRRGERERRRRWKRRRRGKRRFRGLFSPVSLRRISRCCRCQDHGLVEVELFVKRENKAEGERNRGRRMRA